MFLAGTWKSHAGSHQGFSLLYKLVDMIGSGCHKEEEECSEWSKEDSIERC